ncbi:NAD(P)/FAD-dependent oxidoreductase [Scandinavium manionii]|uniref:NAD(P)/FAD-dependent oxidoreductase n=1 Tax=Scandinavium manionii TaxID=2926520 RepID=UPI00135C8DBB|nr:FAD-dependent oxidoreductase [Scandinavium manionii]MCS2167746.1 FAD-dependent oxidoreductase [Scandinavium manionii]
MSKLYDVIIIGAGPAGLGVARALQHAGVKDVLLIERESQPGGVPKHCRHPTFGMLTFLRPMKGHTWAEKLLTYVQYPIRTATTVTSLLPDGQIEVSSDAGLETLRARKIVLATGVRETPRHPRLVSGVRPQGVLTAGALQQFVYLRGLKPGDHPVIIGTELVSFSAIWTLKSAGVRAVAMIEEGPRPTAWRLCLLFARLLNVPVHCNSRISRINGSERVESIEILSKGEHKTLPCDSVIFTGKFTGEYTLIRKSHLASDFGTGRPLFDQNGACSDPGYYAVGNMTHPADMGDQCYQEGLRIGGRIAAALPSGSIAPEFISVQHDDIIRISAPSIVRLMDTDNKTTFNIRVQRPVTGYVVVRDGSKELYRRRYRCMPERRILLKDVDMSNVTAQSALHISIES